MADQYYDRQIGMLAGRIEALETCVAALLVATNMNPSQLSAIMERLPVGLEQSIGYGNSCKRIAEIVQEFQHTPLE